MKSKNQKVSEMLDLWGVFVFSYAASLLYCVHGRGPTFHNMVLKWHPIFL